MEKLPLPSEEFLIPVERFNLAVGPLFAEFRFPLPEHKSGLRRSLGIFLDRCFRDAMHYLGEMRPVPLSKEEWLAATPETKATHLKWQRNLGYLRDRNRHFVLLLLEKREKPKKDRGWVFCDPS